MNQSIFPEGKGPSHKEALIKIYDDILAKRFVRLDEITVIFQAAKAEMETNRLNAERLKSVAKQMQKERHQLKIGTLTQFSLAIELM